MKRSTFFLLASSLLIACGGGSGESNNDDDQITVQSLNFSSALISNGQSVSGASVSVHSSDFSGLTIDSDTTDAQGRFELSVSPGQTLYFTYSSQGYVPTNTLAAINGEGAGVGIIPLATANALVSLATNGSIGSWSEGSDKAWFVIDVKTADGLDLGGASLNLSELIRGSTATDVLAAYADCNGVFSQGGSTVASCGDDPTDGRVMIIGYLDNPSGMLHEFVFTGATSGRVSAPLIAGSITSFKYEESSSASTGNGSSNSSTNSSSSSSSIISGGGATGVEEEPNNTGDGDRANIILNSIVGSVNGSISTNTGTDTSDFFVFTPPTSKPYIVTLAWNGAADLDILVLNFSISRSGGNDAISIGESLPNGTAGATLTNPESASVNLTAGVPVLIVVEGYETSGATVNYTLTIE